MSDYICNHGHRVTLRYEQFDIRLEVRRSDAAERPKVETVVRSCKQHYLEDFAAALGRMRENIEQGSLAL